MKTYVLLGFELKLYSPYELYYVYYYLSEIIINCQLKNFNRLNSFFIKNEKSLKANNQKRKNKTKDYFSKDIMLLTAERYLNIGYYLVLKGLMNENFILSTNKRFDNEEIRYNHRFQLFQNVTIPPYCNFSDFVSKDHNTESKILFSRSNESFDYTRNILENPIEKIESNIPMNVLKKMIVITRLFASGYRNLERVQLNFEENIIYSTFDIQKAK
jgi:hypothetical protein